jgi:hypothetical protein
MGSVMALGYQGDPASLPNKRFQSQEQMPRTRKPLSELVLSDWGRPAELG